MKRLLGVATAAIFVWLLSAPFAVSQQSAKFNGQILDEKLNCAQSPMKAAPGITRIEACVLYWTRYANPATKLVLYDAATKTTYQLDDQEWVQPYVGAKVEITGTLNNANKTIRITGLKKA